MKQIKYIIITVVIFICSTSCKKKFLEVEDNSIVLREQYVKDLGSLQEYLNGIYVVLNRDFYNGIYGHQICDELTADNVKPTAGNTNLLLLHYNWKQTYGIVSALDNGRDWLWQYGYNLIRSCNFIIDKIDDLKEEDVKRADNILGQAYSIRALVHFTLVNAFAQSYNFSVNASHPGVPYITNWDWNDRYSRNTTKEVYDGIISDLATAISLFPTGSVNKLAMNQYAAKALLARVYLFQEEWQKAKNLAIEVATAVPLLASASYPQKLFTPDETEALFQLIPSSTTALNGSFTTTPAGFQFRSTAFLATKDIADLLSQNPSDKRSVWILSAGPGLDSVRKFPINVLPNFGAGINGARSYFQSIFRSSEMFLTVAEASAKSGDEATARTYLDAIRQRASPAAISSTATGSALLDSIYIERRKELAFEGLRMWDLLRWKKAVTRIDATVGSPLVLPYPSDKAIAPIPLQDVKYGIPQNPSY